MAFLIDHAPVWVWKPGNLRFIGSHVVHFCFGHEGRRTIEWDSREIAIGRRIWLDGRIMDAAEVLRALDALNAAGVRAGVTGGWGIDALLRRQTRSHGDVDLGVPSTAIDGAIEVLLALGYTITADERPARVVLTSDDGQVDLHPIVMLPSGTGVQTGFDGQTFEYPPGSLEAEGEIGGRIVRCGTPELQMTFHRGYEPREHDRLDMAALAEAFGLTLKPPHSG